MASKSPDAFRTISEVAEWLDRPAHVLRFWESKFTQVKPVKRAGGRRYYRPQDMLLLGGIKKLLHDDGMTIKGVQKLIRENGVQHVAAMSQSLESDAPPAPAPEKEAPIDLEATAVPEAETSDNLVTLFPEAAMPEHAPVEKPVPPAAEEHAGKANEQDAPVQTSIFDFTDASAPAGDDAEATDAEDNSDQIILNPVPSVLAALLSDDTCIPATAQAKAAELAAQLSAHAGALKAASKKH